MAVGLVTSDKNFLRAFCAQPLHYCHTEKNTCKNRKLPPKKKRERERACSFSKWKNRLNQAWIFNRRTSSFTSTKSSWEGLLDPFISSCHHFPLAAIVPAGIPKLPFHPLPDGWGVRDEPSTTGVIDSLQNIHAAYPKISSGIEKRSYWPPTKPSILSRPKIPLFAPAPPLRPAKKLAPKHQKASRVRTWRMIFCLVNLWCIWH